MFRVKYSRAPQSERTERRAQDASAARFRRTPYVTYARLFSASACGAPPGPRTRAWDGTAGTACGPAPRWPRPSTRRTHRRTRRLQNWLIMRPTHHANTVIGDGERGPLRAGHLPADGADGREARGAQQVEGTKGQDRRHATDHEAPNAIHMDGSPSPTSPRLMRVANVETTFSLATRPVTTVAVASQLPKPSGAKMKPARRPPRRGGSSGCSLPFPCRAGRTHRRRSRSS